MICYLRNIYMLSSDYNIFMSDNIVRHMYVVETYEYVLNKYVVQNIYVV